jgi:fumarate reductase subunit D
MLRRVLPLTLLFLLLLPAAAFGSEAGMEEHKEYVTEFFIGLIVLIMLIFAVIAGFEARRARRNAQ